MSEIPMMVSYHQQTKHHFHAYAPGPPRLDWATQPNPFRRYEGATLLPLEHLPPGDTPLYGPAFMAGHIAPESLNRRSLSQLFYDSLALSAWKEMGGEKWALRINPSSGNLHPTEGYLICGPVEGLCGEPMICHYAPKEHSLERRAGFPIDTWKLLATDLPEGAVLIGLSTIYWREAWKYGARAFRYSHHDIGHAIGAISIAAAGLGWEASLLDDIGTEFLENLLGVSDQKGSEAEHPDCLLAIYPCRKTDQHPLIRKMDPVNFKKLQWEGKPNFLSASHVSWPIIDDAIDATRKPATPGIYGTRKTIGKAPETTAESISLRKMIHQRRSAVDFDGQAGLARDGLYQILLKTMPFPGQVPFNTLPWDPLIHLGLFVHRVLDLDPGLYFLTRDPAQKEDLRVSMKDTFDWKTPEGCPDGLALYHLVTGDARGMAAQVSCGQDIASDGCFSLGMIADFEKALERYGAWFYPRLYWECGMIGQVLYLEAEAMGIRGTGIGCFFD
ncbi:MAG TPA: SagB/ThcOx family dehydrogenase, partial [Nitrospiria bacterium]|nr:SagB/ThcOx family dehydrogenase [Nitrospiria bacterium]